MKSRLICKDCRTEIFADGSMVMVKDSLWLKICDKMSDAICDTCMEKRLGRKITEKDFKKPSIPGRKIIPCNQDWLNKRNNTKPTTMKKKKSKHKTVNLHGTTVADKVITVMANVMNIDKKRIKQNSKIEDLPADSLDQVEIIMELEKKFNICIPDDRVEEFTSVRKMVNYITKEIK